MFLFVAFMALSSFSSCRDCCHESSCHEIDFGPRSESLQRILSTLRALTRPSGHYAVAADCAEGVCLESQPLGPGAVFLCRFSCACGSKFGGFRSEGSGYRMNPFFLFFLPNGDPVDCSGRSGSVPPARAAAPAAGIASEIPATSTSNHVNNHHRDRRDSRNCCGEHCDNNL